jgi:two-component system, OmpR family, phosphate regulon sensor histidine kinase PhoR
MSPSLRREMLKLFAALAAGALAGLWAGSAAAGIAIVLGIAVAWQLRNLAALRRWLGAPKRVELLPNIGGLWGDTYRKLVDLQRRNSRRHQRLLAMLNEFQASASALRDGAVVLDDAGRIAWVNEAAKAMLGLESPQDIGQRLPNLVRMPAFSEYFAAGNFDKELVMPAPENPAVTLSLKLIPYGNHQLLLMVRDVSELKRLEYIRRDFVANASHELRTPLTVLKGYLDMMEPGAREGGALAQWHAPLEEMRAQAARMEALIADLLKLAQIESGLIQGRHELLDVGALLQQALAEAQALSDGRHRFEVDIDTGLLLYGRELELRSIFSNLAGNAVRYTPEGGLIRLSWKAAGEGAEFAVADTGIGIDPAHLPRLTERFYRVDIGRSSASGGTGLGLSIVKHALENLDGELRIDSRPGSGSTFTSVFPPHRVGRRSAGLSLAVPE